MSIITTPWKTLNVIYSIFGDREHFAPKCIDTDIYHYHA